MIQIQQIKLKIPHKETDVKKKFCKILHIPEKRAAPSGSLSVPWTPAASRSFSMSTPQRQRWRGRKPLESISRRTVRSRSAPRCLITPIRLPAQRSFPIVR